MTARSLGLYVHYDAGEIVVAYDPADATAVCVEAGYACDGDIGDAGWVRRDELRLAAAEGAVGDVDLFLARALVPYGRRHVATFEPR